MKRVILCLSTLILVIYLVWYIYPKNDTDYVRIHIRANSNLEVDQEVKMKVKCKVVEFLSPKLNSSATIGQSLEIIDGVLSEIQNITDKILLENGFSYKSTLSLNKEYFPLREYNNLVLDSGNYDALIISLGDGEGDNWWCVVYPPLCFTEGDVAVVDNIKYKSLTKELFDKLLAAFKK